MRQPEKLRQPYEGSFKVAYKLPSDNDDKDSNWCGFCASY